MGNKTQLARIVVPEITDSGYATGISEAFTNINNNFKKIASLPFVQGVQGDSYKLVEREIWDTTSTNKEDPNLTSYGVVLLNSIFADLELKFDITNTFSVVNKSIVTSIYDGEIDKAGNPYPSPLSLDFFYTTETKDDKIEIKQVVNNILYFYTVFNDANEITDEYLGQYYYFIDNRLKSHLGEAFNGNKSLLDSFVDYTGFYGYVYNEKSTDGEYRKIDILPTLYYDTTKNDICWKFNGQNTGISAIGPKGEPGKDSDFQMVCVDLKKQSISTKSNGEVTGVFKQGTNGDYCWDPDAVGDLKDSYCMIFIKNYVEADDTEQTVIGFGEIITNQDGDKYAYWNNNTLLNTTAINGLVQSYFYNMGVSNTANSPHFLAIPANSDRTGIKENDNHAHVFKTNIESYKTDTTSNIGGDLEIFYSSDAFSNGLTNGGASATNFSVGSTGPNMNIKNYNVNIDKNLDVTGNATIDGDTTIGGTLGVTGTANIGTLNVTSNASIGGTLNVTETATIGSDTTIGGTLGVTGTANIGTLNVTSNASIGGTLSVIGAATFDDDLSVGDTLSVTGSVTFSAGLDVTDGDLDVTDNVTIGGDLEVNGESSFNKTVNIIGTPHDGDSHPGLIVEGGNGRLRPGELGGVGLIVRGGTVNKPGSGIITSGLGLRVETGGAVINDDLTVGETLAVTGTATFDNDLSVGTRLVVNSGGTNNVSDPSEIYGNYANTGDTTNGGTGLVVYGGAGSETDENYQGKGGVGLIVYGGLAGNFTGSTSSLAGYGGTGLVVYGGQAGRGPAGVANTGHTGAAIRTYGDVIIGDRMGGYLTTISSSNKGTDINGIKIIDNKVKAQNGFFQTSDARLKNIVEPISVDLDKLSKLRKVYFKWKDNSSSNNEIGMIAQDVQKIYPELVYENCGHLSLAYDKLSVIALEAIDVLNEKNKELEKRIEKLEQFIK